LALAVATCGLLAACNQQHGEKTGMAFLQSINIDAPVVKAGAEMTFNNNGAEHKADVLDSVQIHALHLDSLMSVDLHYCTANVWGVMPIEGSDNVLLLGQVEYSDTRPCFMAIYDGEGNLCDMMSLGECGGLNLTYWDQVNEQTYRKGADSLKMVIGTGNHIDLDRWITLYETSDEDKTHADLWYIEHKIPVTIDENSHFKWGEVTSTQTVDNELLTPYWSDKRQLEVFSWMPLSDTSFAERLNNFLDQAKSDLTDPRDLLGDFTVAVGSRMRKTPDAFMQWLAQHPESQLTKATVKELKQNSLPEQLRYDVNQLQDAPTREFFLKNLFD